MTLKVGLIVGREWSFPPAFIEEVNRRNEGVTAEYVTLGAPRMDQPSEYAVIIDRISHEVPFYRTYLKQAVLQGCTVVNNPFMWTADDKFFGAALATSLGIAHPKTVVLPNKEYIPGIVPEESLRNLQYPLDWQGVVDYVGLPCVLKDAHGGGWKDVYICRSLEELIYHYDNSGLLTMVVQEFIKWDHFIRCICLGQEEVLPIRYDPGERRYHVDHAHMSDELGRRVVDDSLKLVRALGYDMNSMEWAVKDGVPYAIDFMNPAPDMDVYSLTEHYFQWVVTHMADMAIRLAKNPRQQGRELGWAQLFQGRRQMEDAVAASPMIHAPLAGTGSGEAYATTSGGEGEGRGGYLIGGGRSGEGGNDGEGGGGGGEGPGGETPTATSSAPAADGGGTTDSLSADAGGTGPGAERGGYLIGGGRSGERGEDPGSETQTATSAASADEGSATMEASGGYLIGGGRAGEEPTTTSRSADARGTESYSAAPGGAEPADEHGGYLIGGGRSGERGEAPDGEAPSASADEGSTTMEASGGYLIGGGRAGDEPTTSSLSADAGGAEPRSADDGGTGPGDERGGYLIGGGRAGGGSGSGGTSSYTAESADPGDAPDEVVDEEASEGHA
jgi:hypothetical protein